MPDRLSIHAPVLVNTIGHCAGAIIFGILLYLLLLDWKRATGERSPLPSVAAGLALLWNLGSLIGMATSPHGDPVADAIVAGSFSVLSLLPAVLLHISLRSRHKALWTCGYVVSFAAVVLHIGDLVTGAPRFHYAAILLVTIGFAVLTVVSVIHEALSGPRDGSGPRLVGAMVLFLFAISFVHFESAHDIKAWSGEAALHHAGIPLALFVLLQDYRFLLLDAFIRFLVSGCLAALAVWTAFEAEARFDLLAHARRDPFYAGLIFTIACLALSLFAYLRGRGQRFLTRVVFLRAHSEQAASRLREIPGSARDETEYLSIAGRVVADFFSASRVDLIGEPDADVPDIAAAALDPGALSLEPWARAVAPLRFSRGDMRLLVLGPRTGGRRYLSEDIEVLQRLAIVVCEQVERMRNSEMQTLVSEAELRSLQAQINPHFLFNALNTLYGIIARENSSARHLVLNLAGLFRYSFGGNRGLIRIAGELDIVRAYLEIEQLRLGPKLSTEIDVDDAALQAEVPVLSIQPLMENAVKHGVAPRRTPGFVRLQIRKDGEAVTVEISNSGSFREPLRGRRREGVGLKNVRRRLALCYGEEHALEISSAEDVTTVRFSLPWTPAVMGVRSSANQGRS
ncbi:MAG TPA: histidine kinase [Bryobacteraceae bacterium]|nr:histidine kinase [Bryobacteraceae bacterium]